MKPVQFYNRIQKLLKSSPALSGTLHQIDVGDVMKIPTAKQCFLIVVSGRIEIHLPSPIGNEFCCETLTAGDCLAPHRELFADNFSEYFLKAPTPSSFMLPSERDFESLLASNRLLVADLLCLQIQRAAALRRDAERLRMVMAENRLIHYLLTENLVGDDGQIAIKGYLHEMADKLDIAPATLSRIMLSLQKRGILSRSGRQFQVPRQFLELPSPELGRDQALGSVA